MTDIAGPAASRHIETQQRRGFWLRTLHQWHWISSAVCLIGMLLFTAAGITLNHAARIEGEPRVDNRALTLPPSLLATLAAHDEGDAALPEAVADWLGDALDVAVGAREAEWPADEVYLSLPGPGKDAWISIDKASPASTSLFRMATNASACPSATTCVSRCWKSSCRSAPWARWLL